MIAEIRLENFKRFRDLTLKTANLTVLTGANGAGKTSILHSLLLARQMVRRNLKKPMSSLTASTPWSWVGPRTSFTARLATTWLPLKFSIPTAHVGAGRFVRRVLLTCGH